MTPFSKRSHSQSLMTISEDENRVVCAKKKTEIEFHYFVDTLE